MSATTKKITKKEMFTIIRGILDAAEQKGIMPDEKASYDEMKASIDHEIELLDSKAVAAQKRAAAKKEEGDALREEVFGVLSETEYMTIDEIVAAIGNPDVTRNMVTSRLGQLSKADRVEKDSVTVSAGEGAKSRKASAYRRKA